MQSTYSKKAAALFLLVAVLALSGILVWGEYTKPFAATVDMVLQNEVWVVSGIR